MLIVRRRSRKGRPLWLTLVYWVARLTAVFIVLSLLLVGALRWVDPPTTAFILQHNWAASRDANIDPAWQHWVPWTEIPRHAPLAVIAAEDQRFLRHHGFDFDSIGDAVDAYRRSGRIRGASTISQQVAKNLFLWPARSLLRKGVEAYFTLLIETLWPKKRILEVYLNTAQFGSNIYGIEAASQAYFGKPAATLTTGEAALLAAVLPNPVRYRVDAPSDYVRERQRWIERQMRQLGGPGHLDAL